MQPQQQPWAPPPAPQQPAGEPPRQRLLWAVVLATAAVAVAALAVGVIGLTRPRPSPTPASPPTSSTTMPKTPSANATEADRALCTAIAPIMKDYDRTSNAWLGNGPPGTPARDAALPKYKSDTEDWAGNIQDVLDAHPNADPLFKRTLQRFIDDRVLLVRNMRAGKQEP